MRERNPCLRLRRRTFGWYVRFIEKRFLGKSRFDTQGYGRQETLSKLGEPPLRYGHCTAKSRSRSRNNNHGGFAGNGPHSAGFDPQARPLNPLCRKGSRLLKGEARLADSAGFVVLDQARRASIHSPIAVGGPKRHLPRWKPCQQQNR